MSNKYHCSILTRTEEDSCAAAGGGVAATVSFTEQQQKQGGRKNLRVDQESDLYRKTTTTKITFELGMTTGTKKNN